MDLFTSAGVEFDESRRPGSRPGRVPRTLRVPLLAHKVVAAARKLFTFDPTPRQLLAAANYAKTARNTKFAQQKETSVRNLFTENVLGEILGYKPYVESPGGISPPGAPRSVHEPLDSHGSRCSAASMAQLPMSE